MDDVSSANGILYRDSTVKLLSLYVDEYQVVVNLLDIMYTRLTMYAYRVLNISGFNGNLLIRDILSLDEDEEYVMLPTDSTIHSIGAIFYVFDEIGKFGFYTKIYFDNSTDPEIQNTLTSWTQPDIMSKELYTKLYLLGKDNGS